MSHWLQHQAESPNALARLVAAKSRAPTPGPTIEVPRRTGDDHAGSTRPYEYRNPEQPSSKSPRP